MNRPPNDLYDRLSSLAAAATLLIAVALVVFACRPALNSAPAASVVETTEIRTALSIRELPPSPPPTPPPEPVPPPEPEPLPEPVPEPLPEPEPEPEPLPEPEPVPELAPEAESEPVPELAPEAESEPEPEPELQEFEPLPTVPTAPEPESLSQIFSPPQSETPGPTLIDRLTSELLEFIEKHKLYPIAARRAGITGVVTLRIEIAADGRIQAAYLSEDAHRFLQAGARRTATSLANHQLSIAPGQTLWVKVPVRYEISN